ncbi:MAG TPA: hypothetical protein VGD37_31730 [Kofleriaceae bacterium]
MQLEDKLVEDRDAAHAESQQREDVEDRGEDTLPAPVTEALHDAALEHRGELLGAVRMILDRQHVEISQLRMPVRESSALDALQVAVDGKSSDLNQFVYASDRRDLLERALGVLQPNLTRADDQTARELHAQFADLAERVAELRHELTDLEDAQDELLEGHEKDALQAPGAPPKPPPKPSDPDAPRPATTLTGPEMDDLPATPPPATTLTGPDLPATTPAPTTLIGPERPEPPRPASLLTDPGQRDLPEAPPPPSTLGADAATQADGPAGGDPAKPGRPWWRRPFG